MIIKNKIKKNSKGISVMIGYILLITITIVISTIVYQQLRSYVPTEAVKCPEGVSIFLKEVVYNCDDKELNITLKNNGRFSIGGYFITATDSLEKELATIDLSKYNELGVGGFVIFDFLSENSMSPGKEMKSFFDLSNASSAQFYSLNIIPVRYQEIKNRNRIVSCGDSRIKETLTCFEECIPNTCSDLSYICGEWSDGCGDIINCGDCTTGNFCDAVGECISSVCAPAADPSLSGVCGTQQCGTAINGTCGSVSCGTCASGFVCDITEQCISLCGNGVIDSGETCDDENIINGDGCSSICTVESGFTCSGEPSVCAIPASVIDCSDYCAAFPGFTGGGCLQNPQQCSQLNPPGTYIGDVSGANETLGNSFCTIGNSDACCCQP